MPPDSIVFIIFLTNLICDLISIFRHKSIFLNVISIEIKFSLFLFSLFLILFNQFFNMLFLFNTIMCQLCRRKKRESCLKYVTLIFIKFQKRITEFEKGGNDRVDCNMISTYEKKREREREK